MRGAWLAAVTYGKVQFPACLGRSDLHICRRKQAIVFAPVAPERELPQAGSGSERRNSPGPARVATRICNPISPTGPVARTSQPGS